MHDSLFLSLKQSIHPSIHRLRIDLSISSIQLTFPGRLWIILGIRDTRLPRRLTRNGEMMIRESTTHSQGTVLVRLKRKGMNILRCVSKVYGDDDYWAMWLLRFVAMGRRSIHPSIHPSIHRYYYYYANKDECCHFFRREMMIKKHQIMTFLDDECNDEDETNN